MEYLYFLQQLRQTVPGWLNETILFLSEFIGSTGGIVLMALVYWCISKRAGTLLLTNFSLAYVCNTVIKNIFCIERPFRIDTRLEPYVPASGYSFPSGHTMLAAGVYGGLAVWQRRRVWFAALCVFMTFFTAFTRNWLGVHTLEDVLVGILCSACVVGFNCFMLEWADKVPGRDRYVFAAAVLVFAAFCLLYPTSLKTAGIYAGVMLGWILERRFIRFEISKSISFRVITFVVGVIAVELLCQGILPHLLASCDKAVRDLVINFVRFLMITAGWPMVIKWLTEKQASCSG